MKSDAAIYREAARLIAEGGYNASCYALAVANNFQDHPRIRSTYASIYEPKGAGRMDLWFGSFYSGRERRVMALLFAAAMAEAGDL